MVTNLSASNSLVSGWVRELRDVQLQKDRMRFRRNMERIGEIAAYEISKVLAYKEITIETPLAETTCAVLAIQPVLVTILRAGMPLYQGLLSYFDHADSAFAGSYRKHSADGSFEISNLYMTSPPLDGRPLIIADPMLATGASMVATLTSLLEYDHPSEIHLVCAIAAKEGIELVLKHFPSVNIWTAAIDKDLTDKAYILPGLGDAGDLAFGEKRQS
ncbi:MAG: uracil phosphoribosyltransferase [Bacteroidota bacterium]